MGEAIKTKAIVLNKVDYKDNDRILTLFSLEKGKITVSVKGVKKTTSKLRPCSEMFFFGQYILNETRGRFTVTGFDTIDTFSALREDFDKLSAGVLMLKMCEKAIEQDEQDEELFILLLKCLDYLRENDSIGGVLAVFLLKYCTVLGYAPQFKKCVKCGQSDKLIYLDFALGGIVCSRCGTKNEHIAITGECLENLSKIVLLDIDSALNLIKDKKQEKEAYNAAKKYTAYLFDEKIKIMEYIAKYNLV